MPSWVQLYCQVEIPKGTPVLSPGVRESEQLRLSQVRCPADWCYFPDTLARDEAPLGAIVCVSEPGSRGRPVAVRPIALLRTHDIRGYEEIVVCVALEDPAWTEVESIYEIPRQLREEIENFAVLKQPRRNNPAVGGWLSSEHAMTAIDDAAARWAATVNGRG